MFLKASIECVNNEKHSNSYIKCEGYDTAPAGVMGLKSMQQE